MVKVKDLVKAPWNYKEEDPEKQAKLDEGVRTRGQIVSVIVRQIGRGKLEIVNGNHRQESFVKAGLKEVMAYDMGRVSDAEAKLVAVATNELEFKANDARLYEVLRDIQVEIPTVDMAKVLPWDPNLIDDKIGSLTFDFSQFNQTPPTPAEMAATGQPPVDPAQVQASPPDAPGLGPAVVEGGDTDRLTVVLPKEEMRELRAQIRRIKKLMYPEDQPEHVADSAAWAAILQAVIATKDAFFK